MPLTELRREMQTIGVLLELATQNRYKSQGDGVVWVLGVRSDTIQQLDTTGITQTEPTLDSNDAAETRLSTISHD